jgi:anthranilate phosphoribosyltransferase
LAGNSLQGSLLRVVEGKSLSEQEAFDLMDMVMSGEATEAQIGALLAALRAKGETVEEITGFARAMRAKALRIQVNTQEPLTDTCGTGGDASDTFNVSTGAALIAAACGVKVAKHGNRSVSSKCGSADAFEALGVNLDPGPEKVARCIEQVGIGFLFAPTFHPAMRYAVKPRRELGMRTVFNLLGPLTNPACAQIQLLGVFLEQWVEPLARVLVRLGTQRAWVVHGLDGMDEVSLCGPTRVSEARGGKVGNFLVTPEEFGLQRCQASDLVGGDAAESSRMLLEVLQGAEGPRADAVALNAAAALFLAGKAASPQEGVALAREAVASGAARKTLERLVAATQ